jgi:cephalosporin hydroxylase
MDFKTALLLARANNAICRDDELLWLYHLAERSSVGIEVGSWLGGSGVVQASVIKGRLFCVDSWSTIIRSSRTVAALEKLFAQQQDVSCIYRQFCFNLDYYINSGKCVPIKSTSEDAIHKLHELGVQNDSVDYVYIDADHSYEHVKQDIAFYSPFVRQGGTISGHDYEKTHSDVILAVNEAFGSNVRVPSKTHIWWTTKQ